VRKLTKSAAVGFAGAALLVAGVQQPAGAAPVAKDGPTAASAKAAPHRSDNSPDPRPPSGSPCARPPIDNVAKGKADPNDQAWSELATTSSPRPRTTAGPTRSSRSWPTSAPTGPTSWATRPGPVHNQDPEAGPQQGQLDAWTADFNKAHYETLFNGPGESMKTYYSRCPNGAYTVENTVSDWVTVPHNGSYYGDNSVEDLGGRGRSSRTPGTLVPVPA
jgi:immune inhibitor A